MNVTKRTLIVALAAAVIILRGENLFAKTVVVGDASCQPGPQHFTTIQAAVNSLPSGGTVLVCPGTYPEQVTINASYLILRGVVNGIAGAPVITVPATGLVPNVTPGLGLVATQLLVQ